MRTTKLLPFLALAALVACASTGIYKLVVRPYNLEGVDFPMPSGLRAFFQEDHGQPSIMVVSVIGSGASQDPKGKEGLAHLMEHLWFRSRHEENLRVDDRIKVTGGIYNAFTDHDQTTFFTIAPREGLGAVLTLEAHRLTEPLAGITEEVVQVEREVVRNEIRFRGETTLMNGAMDTLYSMVYPEGHAYSRPVGGTHASLDAITLEDLRAFTAAHYRPENTTLVVSGDFTKEEATKALGRALPASLIGKVTPGAPPPPAPAPRVQAQAVEPPPPAVREIRHVTGPVTRPRVMLGWSLPNGYSDNDYLMQATSEAMMDAVGSLLLPDGLYDDEKTGDLGCGVLTAPVSAFVVCMFDVAEGQDPDTLAKKAVDGIWEVADPALAKYHKRGISRGKAMTMARLLNDSASLGRRTVPVAQSLHFSSQPNYFSRAFKQLGGINETAVRKLAYKYLTRERVAVVVFDPEESKESSRVRFDSSSDYSGAVVNEKDELEGRFAKMANAEIEKVAMVPDLSLARELTLANGMKVILKRHGSGPFLQVAVMSRGGRLDGDPSGISEFARDAHEARDPLQVAGYWRRLPEADFGAIGLALPSGNLAAAVDLVATRLETTHSAYEKILDEHAYKYQEKEQQAQVHDPDWVLEREQLAKMFPNHPLSQVQYDFDKLRQLGKADYERWLTTTWAPANLTLIAVGDINLDEAAALIQTRLGAWRATDQGSRRTALPAVPSAPSRAVLLIDRPQKVQASLSLMCPLAPATLDNGDARQVATDLLDDAFYRGIRASLGATYGVHVLTEEYRGGTSFMRISSVIQGDKLVPSLAIILQELKALSEGKVNTGRMQEMKWNLARRTHTSTMGIDNMLFTLLNLERFDYPLESMRSAPARIASVDAQKVADVLAPCIGHELIGVVGSAEPLRKGLSELGPVSDVAFTPAK